jgi:hypothetical protein
LAKLKLVSVGDNRYQVLAEIPITSKVNLEVLRKSYNTDTILQSNNTYYPSRKLLEAEIEVITDSRE